MTVKSFILKWIWFTPIYYFNKYLEYRYYGKNLNKEIEIRINELVRISAQELREKRTKYDHENKKLTVTNYEEFDVQYIWREFDNVVNISECEPK